ncbi:hypothetical protein BV20DRAFT_963553 [Pilatotrama ljubarskyi]|nr:hypothetical protein BV20DRAFT_963553 [Pilatotrama ljubarskyi]
MKATSASALAFAAVLQATVAAAQTSLYIPGFDPQAITADVEGVDAQGRTTWRFGPGVTSGTYEDPAGIIGSATLVADATEAHVVWVNSDVQISLSEDCGIANGIAVCTGVASAEGTVESFVETQTAVGFEVQGGGAGAAAPTGSATTEATPTGSPAGSAPAGTGSGAGSSVPTAGSGISSGPSATGSADALNPTTTAKDNGVAKTGASMLVSVGVVGLVSAFFL